MLNIFAMWLKYKEKIETPRLVLRQFSQQDIPAMQAFANNPDVLEYLLWERKDELYFSGNNIPRYCTPQNGIYAVVLKQSAVCIGNIEITLNKKDKSCTFFYMINPEYWGNGYASEALRGMISFCFGQLRLQSVHASHFAENPASGRVMQKSGMLYSKTVNGEIFMRGVSRDVVYYALNMQQWKQSLPHQ